MQELYGPSSVLDPNKDKMQEEALNTWINSEYKGTVVVGTGAGKTRIGCVAINHLYRNGLIKSCLIVVPTTNLRDNEWINELIPSAVDKEPLANDVSPLAIV